MYKLFTVEEAQDMIPVVDRTLRAMQSDIKDALELQKALGKAPAYSLNARNLAQELEFLMGSVQQSKAELDRMGVHLKDVDAGLVDFPSQLGAEVVYLCWEQGQEAITHYHRVTDNESARLPLPQAKQEQAAGA